MIRITSAQFATAALLATVVHATVLGTMAFHETPAPVPEPEAMVFLELASLGDPLGELDPSAPAADEALAISADVPELQETRPEYPTIPDQPPPPDLAPTEAEAPDIPPRGRAVGAARSGRARPGRPARNA